MSKSLRRWPPATGAGAILLFKDDVSVCFGWKADVRSDLESHKRAANSLSCVALATAVAVWL
jgi:hypothetical protein